MAKNEKFNEEDGVWRTIGGRRVFIKNGQSLSDAMKESGKFKNAKKKEMTSREASEEQLKRAKTEYKDVADLRDEYEDKVLSKADEEDKKESKLKQNNDAKNYYSKLSEKEIKQDLEERKNRLDNGFYDKKDKEMYQKFYDEGKKYYDEKYGNDNSFDMRKYDVQVEHDNGKATISVVASDEESAKKMVMKAENAPESAIKSVKDNGSILGNDKKTNDIMNKAKSEGTKTNENYRDKSSDYRNKITDVAKNSKKDNVTLDVETGKPVNFDKGYSVSFQQSTDNYTDEEYAEKVAECRDKCDGKVYAGKYGGDAEASFHTDNLDDAKELMYKYNQESIYDWKHQTLIMNDKYDASKNQTNYKEKSTNDYMNDKIKKGASKNKAKDDLPKKTEIKTQGTSNRKEVSENIQAHILDYYDSPEDFIQQMDAMDYLPTKWHAGEEIAKGGGYMIYYDEQRDFLDSLKINPKGKNFSDDRVFQTYTSLIGRESAKLYDRLKKNEYRKYMKQHPGSKMTFSEYKDMKKGGE